LEKKLKKIALEASLSEKKIFDILLIGSEGLLGSEIKKQLINYKVKIFTVARINSDFNLDLLKFKKLNIIFKENSFKYIINCAAKVDLVFCERNFFYAKIINSNLVKFLATKAKLTKCRLVQISTDHFFINKKFKYNKESDKMFPINKYSKTKKIAEAYAKKNKNNLIIRTNFTGLKKKLTSTFVGWIYFNIIRKRTINLYNDMYVSTLDVKYCASIIVKLIFSGAKGIYNLGSRDSLTKKNFALLFARKLKRRIYFQDISFKDSYPKRGQYLALNVDKIQKKLNIKLINSNQVLNNLSKYFK
jgi:dTDP-4-dehydrorhamnose reductase